MRQLDRDAILDTDYDEELAGHYWGVERFGSGADDEEAVLGLNRLAAVNRAYGEWELRSLERLLSEAAGGLALDLGAGVGRIARHLAPAWRVVALDRAPGMVARCRSNLERNADAVATVQASALAVPFSDETFDVVVCLGVIEHLPEGLELALLRECLRVLRVGGRLALEVNNAHSVLLRSNPDNSHRTGKQLENGYLCRLVDPDRVVDSLSSLGGVVTDIAVNPFYSLLRHSSAGNHEKAFALAQQLDTLATYHPAGRQVADQVLFLVRKRS